MRLRSLTVRHFRGVGEARVEPLGTGVTVVQGPNEAGKTSLVDALDVLFTRRDDTTAAEVREAQPLGRDVGPEVAVEAEAGPYRFRYRKRFLKDRETVLEVDAPAVERLTGREAHERMDEILGEVLDRDLWRALRLRQGDDALQPGGLAGSRSLLGALGGAEPGGPGRSRGGTGGGELLDRARKERERYFTPVRGDATGELAEGREELASAEEEAGRLEREMAALEADAERAGRLERRIAELAGAVDAAAATSRAAAGELERVSRLEDELRARQGEAAEARELARALAELAEAVDAEREVAERLRAARAEEAEAAAALAPAAAEAEAAASAAAAARARVERLRRRVRLAERRAAAADLAARRDRAAGAARRVAGCEARLADLPVDDAAVDDLEERWREAERLAATLAAASPDVAVTAESEVRIETRGGGDVEGGGESGGIGEVRGDGEVERDEGAGGPGVAASAARPGDSDLPAAEERTPASSATLGAGATRAWRPGAPWTLRLPGVVRFEVRPGADAEAAARRLAEVREGIAARCRELGVDDEAATRRAHRERREAEAELGAARAVLAEALAGRRAESLDEAVTEAEAEVERLAREVEPAAGADGDAGPAEGGEGAAASAPESAADGAAPSAGPPGDLAHGLAAAEEELRSREAAAQTAVEERERRERAHRRAAEVARSLAVRRRDAGERGERAAGRLAELTGDEAQSPGLFVDPAGDEALSVPRPEAAVEREPAAGSAGRVAAVEGGGVASAAAAAPQLDLFSAEPVPEPAAGAPSGPAAPVAPAPDPSPSAADRLAAARETLAAAEERTASARRRLAEARPDDVRRRAEDAAGAAGRAGEELRTAQDERIAVLARLESAGERELWSDLGRARARREAARSAAAAVEARAAAADRLLRALETAREEVRAAYAEPLRRAIVELGEPLFGPGFDVELDGELAIARRTAGGSTLPFDRLSGGAKEQLSLLARLACAVLVAPGGGVPVILDDALGSSDEERLRAAGRALTLAGRRCQILVFTCFPSRYRHVEDARVVEMDCGSAGGAADA